MWKEAFLKVTISNVFFLFLYSTLVPQIVDMLLSFFKCEKSPTEGPQVEHFYTMLAVADVSLRNNVLGEGG